MEARFTQVLDAVRANHPDAELGMIERAFRFSERAHAGQTRATGEPYVTHPLDVAYILAHDLHLDATLVCAGLLHDVIEDTVATRDDLERDFGPEVATIVEGLTKIDKYEFKSKAEAEAENFRKMLLAIAHDVRVIVVKLADRLHNMRTLEAMRDDKRRRIAAETLEIYAPLAYRLGMGRIKDELEELGFRYGHPEAYAELAKKLAERRSDAETLIHEIEASLRELMAKTAIRGEIHGRVKKPYSIYRKQQARGSEDLFDFLAFRALVPQLGDCYQMLGLVHGRYTPLPGRFKDYIAIPKDNLYQSLHTTVLGPGGHPFEMQIRTFEMHQLAEEGIAAHWKYKTGGKVRAGEEERFLWLKTMVEAAQGHPGAQQFMETIKGDLYPDEIYAFTPRGEIKVLTQGATALDFAYAVHSQVGEKTQGLKVNGRLVPFSTALRSGDIVEVITAQNARPHRDWLKFVKTPRAQQRIRHVLALEERTRNIEAGKLLLEREMRKAGVTLTEEQLTDWAKKHGLTDLPNLHAAIGFGKVQPRSIFERHLDPEKRAAPKTPVTVPPVRGGGPISIDGMGDLLTFLAGCCKPIHGEPIVGVVSRGKGVAIHSEVCPNLKKGLYAERTLHAEWNALPENAPHQRYEARLRVRTADRPGILAEITAALADLNLNIRAISGGGSHGRGQIDLNLDTPAIEELRGAIAKIEKIQGIHSVERVVC